MKYLKSKWGKGPSLNPLLSILVMMMMMAMMLNYPYLGTLLAA